MILWLLACVGAPQTVLLPAPVPVAAAPAPEPTVEPAPIAEPVLEQPTAEVPLAEPPSYFVDLQAIEGLRFDIRYATDDNFTGAPLPGYAQPGAWMTPRSAAALERVQRAMEARGLGLLVYDAYRPMRATDAMVAWTERTNQQHLITQGYIASRSGHNKGNTIDLTVVDEHGAPLDMGTLWDTFSTGSHTDNASGEALTRRHLLRDAMVAEGFRPYSKEWWHFSWPEKVVHRDHPYGD